jgi:protein O-GlcNAc transferase
MGIEEALASWRGGDHGRARDLCAEHLGGAPEDLAALNLFAMASASLGDTAGAIDALRKAISLGAEDPILYNNLGNALLAAGNTDEAIDWFRKATAAAPGYSDAHCNLGNALHGAGRLHQAVMAYRRAIEHDPKHVRSHYQLGNALRKSGQLRAAAAAYDNAVQLAPSFVEALQNQAGCLIETGQFTAALAAVKRLVALRSDSAEGLHMLAAANQGTGELEAAADAFIRALAREPKNIRCLVGLWRAQRRMCLWVNADRTRRTLQEVIASGEAIAPEWIPWLAASPDDALRMVHAFAAGRFPASQSLSSRVKEPDAKIRIGYVGVDFRDEQTTRFLRDLLNHHDRGGFEITAVSFSARPHDEEANQWLRDTFSHWLDAREQSDDEVIAWLRDAELDIAVDLQGYRGGREQIFGRRVAPVQMQYLGLGGSMGSPHIDYLVADELLVPPEESGSFTERLIYLPGAYCVGGVDAAAPQTAESRRADFGLPKDAFLFACFSPSSSLSAEIFDVWMRLLRQVPGAVLCLAEQNRWMANNLKREAAARGVAADRVLFSPPMADAARRRYLALLDLYLDTPESCLEAVADALQSGLPAVASYGTTFWNRRSASLLQTAGLHELISATVSDYETHALRWAMDDRARLAIRDRLCVPDEARTARGARALCRALENAYRAAIAAARP